MIVIPAIDLRGGNCVRLYQGDYSQETVYNNNPISVAQQWMKQGATKIHIVDLDGSKAGHPVHQEVIYNIYDTTKLPIQVGGGVRTLDDVRAYVDHGIAQVIIGTTAVEDKTILISMLDAYKDRIIVSVDVKDGKVMTAGWLQKSSLLLDSAVNSLQNLGVRTFIVTDITRDSTLKGPDLDLYRSLRKTIKGNLILAGGIGSNEDVRDAIAIGVNGVIVGKALYEKKVTLSNFVST